IPCTAGGTPHTIDRLFGFVKEGICERPTSTDPRSPISRTCGARPRSNAAHTYSGSQPSMHTTSAGADGTRYARPLTVITSSRVDAAPLLVDLDDRRDVLRLQAPRAPDLVHLVDGARRRHHVAGLVRHLQRQPKVLLTQREREPGREVPLQHERHPLQEVVRPAPRA